MEAKRVQILSLLRAGMSAADIARETNTHRSAVGRWKKKISNNVDNVDITNDLMAHKKGAGRPRKMDKKLEKRVMKAIKKDPLNQFQTMRNSLE